MAGAYSYWINSAVDELWINIPSLATSTNTIYVQTTEGSSPSGTDTFVMYDTFSEALINSTYWPPATRDSSLSILNNTLRMYVSSNGTHSNYSMKVGHSRSYYYRFEFYIQTLTIDDPAQRFMGIGANLRRETTAKLHMYFPGVAEITNLSLLSTGTWYVMEGWYPGFGTGGDMRCKISLLSTGASVHDYTRAEVGYDCDAVNLDTVLINNGYRATDDRRFDNMIIAHTYALASSDIVTSDMGSYYEITVNNTTGSTLTDYQIMLDATTFSLSTSTDSVVVSETAPTSDTSTAHGLLLCGQ